MRHRNILAVALLFATAPALAQADYRWEQSDAVKVRFRVYRKLHPIPLRLGTTAPEFRMKFEPKDDGDKIHGRYGSFLWPLVLLEFPTAAPGNVPLTGPAATAPEEEGQAGPMGRKPAASFHEWVTERDPERQDRKFVIKAKDERGRGKTPDHQWWEFTDIAKMTNGQEHFDQLWYNCASVFQLPGREVALVCRVPIKRGTRPDPNHQRWMETMLKSLEPIEVEETEDAVDLRRDTFANTPERVAELDKAKANVANLKGWDYFTTPNYIVLFSWDPEKQTKRRDSYQFARTLVDRLEEMRELYVKEFPPHEKMLNIYSVLRVCDNDEEFMKYGGTGRGVVGWFNPGSKELVVFDDKQRMYGGDKDVIATTMHEGWHQYAHTYFGGPPAELHRWFDEGHGDYFGSWIRKGSSWDYVVARGRFQGIRSQVAQKNYVPIRELVSWDRAKFYGSRRIVDHYEQSYSIIDFLRRGQDRLGRRFDPAWATILDKYRKAMLETKDQKKSVEQAFEGVDWEVFESTWVDWVKSYMK